MTSSSPEDSDAPRESAPDSTASGTRDNPLRGSRTSGAWAGIIALAVVLVFLLVFIAQNTQSVEVTFLGWRGSAPLAVTILVGAVAGLFLAGAAGTLRILQLRRRVKREAKS